MSDTAALILFVIVVVALFIYVCVSYAQMMQRYQVNFEEDIAKELDISVNDETESYTHSARGEA